MSTRKLCTRPDPPDFRDRMYTPSLKPLSACYNDTPWDQVDGVKVLNQHQTSACTGFALAAMIDHLLRRSKRELKSVSPHMLYYFARKYDDLSVDDIDGGSTARGGLPRAACRLPMRRRGR
jgi:hypothetical protein